MSKNKHTMVYGREARLDNVSIQLAGDYVSHEFTTFDKATFRVIFWHKDSETGMESIQNVWEGNLNQIRRCVKKNGGKDTPAMYRDVYAANLKEHQHCWGEKTVVCDDAYTSNR